MLTKILICLLFISNAYAEFKVVTTTTNLASLVKEIAGDEIEVLSITKGVQDPHYLEAKPSYMVKLAKADLLISLGLGLEGGWLPLLVRGARRPELRNASQRHMIACQDVNLLEVFKDREVTRADGDIHPQGNPHFMLGPKNSIKLGEAVLQRLSQLKPESAKVFSKNYVKFKDKMQALVDTLHEKIKPHQKVISYHRTLSYFYAEFQIDFVEVLEPKPGIPPTAKHIMQVIQKIKKEKIRHVLIENYFDDSVAHKIEYEIPNLKVHTIPVAVGGNSKINNLFELYKAIGQLFYE